MAVLLTQTSWGYVASCTGGTAVAATVVPLGTRLRIVGICCGGAATTDITTVQDGNGKLLFSGAGLVNQMDELVICAPIAVDGLAIGFAGATTGYCNVYLAAR